MVAGAASGVVSLYFHIPFCERKCDYCHFYTVSNRDILKDQFLKGLKLEWDLWRPKLFKKKVCSIYFGGGSPALLGPKNIATILSWLERADISLEQDIEISLEANPEDITLSLVKSFAAIGINRVCVGIQSLDDGILREISRRHSAEEGKTAVMAVKNGGISNISVDLMYDLPKQTLTIWEGSLDGVKELPITHLSLYNLVVEPHSVFHRKKNLIKHHLPDSDTSLSMYNMSVEKFQGGGWSQYEISAFEKSGCQSRHNKGYWTGRPFLGFGPSAFSYWEGRRFRNVANLSRYTKALMESRSPIDFEEELPEAAKRRELLAINLRLLEGVDINAFKKKNGNLDSQTLSVIESLVGQGFLKQQGPILALTPRGVLFYETVASEII